MSTSRSFPGFSHLYRIGDGGARNAFRGKLDRIERIPDIWAFLCGEEPPPEPFEVFDAGFGRKLYDFVWTTDFFFLVHDRIVSFLRDHAFTGWRTSPAVIIDRHGNRTLGYHSLQFLGRCGPLQNERSVWAPTRRPGQIGMVHIGRYFDEASWDGSDFFMPKETACITVTERVRDCLQAAKATNVHFRPIDEIEW